MNFKFGELFCGAGGLAYGAKSAGFTLGETKFSISHAWATDLEKDACDTYIKNICPNNPNSVICNDIKKLSLKQLEKISNLDALAFGFPCNDFSMVGEQKGINGTYGPLYSYGVKCLNYFQPKFFVAENVGGLRSANDGKSLERILSEMMQAGYSITPHFYKFEQYGIPQARHRIIIVGIRNDLNIEYGVPLPTHTSPVTCREAIENPPISQDAHNNEFTRQSQIVIDRLKHIKPGQNAFNSTLPAELELKVKGAKISQIYKRLDPLKPAYTVTGSGGGGTHIYHWQENRALTNRERARLQTFPDEFVFVGSKESVRKQIGMAVPPLAAKIIFESILKSFAGTKYPRIDHNIKNNSYFSNINVWQTSLLETSK
jgi:DNA (cytosine-5)-methyltransferase 1